jgi:hypothetical protein
MLMISLLESVLILPRLSRLRPGRLEWKYSQLRLRSAQREHVGFCLWHLTLDNAQAWQLSRSFDVVEPLLLGLDDGVCESGLCRPWGSEIVPLIVTRYEGMMITSCTLDVLYDDGAGGLTNRNYGSVDELA